MPQQLENLLKIYREELEKVTDDRVKRLFYTDRMREEIFARIQMWMSWYWWMRMWTM